LGCGGEEELVFGSARPTQAQSIEPEDALQMSEEHLDLFSFATSDGVGLRLCDRTGSHWRFRVILAAAAFALSGCNANQAINPSSQPPSQVFAGHYVDYNPYDPISYAQKNTGRGGGR
jgi:hypothetical protein